MTELTLTIKLPVKTEDWGSPEADKIAFVWSTKKIYELDKTVTTEDTPTRKIKVRSISVKNEERNMTHIFLLESSGYVNTFILQNEVYHMVGEPNKKVDVLIEEPKEEPPKEPKAPKEPQEPKEEPKEEQEDFTVCTSQCEICSTTYVNEEHESCQVCDSPTCRNLDFKANPKIPPSPKARVKQYDPGCDQACLLCIQGGQQDKCEFCFSENCNG